MSYSKERPIHFAGDKMCSVISMKLATCFVGILIFIDFMKAFDTVEWHYLFDCLKAFNFGPDLINWVKTFYRNIESCVINNGLSSDYSTLTRGVRQGDPLSPYLFLLVIKTLVISIRKNPKVDKIKILIRQQ